MSRRVWTGRWRLVQHVTFITSVALLALVAWSVTRPLPPAPPSMTGSWVGVGTVYDSTGGGSNQVAMLLTLRQNTDGGVTGSASECNDLGQTASFRVTGLAQRDELEMEISGVALRGRRAGHTISLSGSANGTTVHLDVRPGHEGDYTAACDALRHIVITQTP